MSDLIIIPAEFKQVSEVLPLTNHAPDNGMTVNGRQLHDTLKIGTYYTTWIQRAIEQADLAEGVDYFSLSTVEVKNGSGSRTPSKDYYFTLESAKHLALMAKSPVGKVTRSYLIWAEKQWRAGVKAPAEPLKEFAKSQAVSQLDVLRNMIDMFAAQTTAITETKNLVVNVESRLTDNVITQDEISQIYTAINARLSQLGISKTAIIYMHGKQWPTKAFLLGDLKRAFFKSDPKGYTFKDLTQKQVPEALHYVSIWTPSQHATNMFKKFKAFDGRTTEGRELNNGATA